MLFRPNFFLIALLLSALHSLFPTVARAGAEVTVPVLSYHAVKAEPDSPFFTSVVAFEAQMGFLKEKGCHAISLETFSAWLAGMVELPARPVLLTFDDGNRSDYEIVFPILRRHGFVGSLFLIADSIGHADQLSIAEIKEMKAAGFSIGSHSSTHRQFSSIAGMHEAQEFRDSREKLQRQLGVRIDFIAYPYGFFDEATEVMAQKAGYHGAFTIIPGRNARQVNPFELRRLVVSADISNLDLFARFITGDRQMLSTYYRYDIPQYLQKGLRRTAEIEIEEMLRLDASAPFAREMRRQLQGQGAAAGQAGE